MSSVYLNRGCLHINRCAVSRTFISILFFFWRSFRLIISLKYGLIWVADFPEKPCHMSSHVEAAF